MKMKIKFFMLGLAFLGGSVTAFAQKGDIGSAKTNYEKYDTFKQMNNLALGKKNLEDAKAAIDKAASNPKTQEDPLTYTYKALIYGELALADSIETSNAPILAQAQEALKKAKELDKDGTNKELLQKGNTLLAQYSLAGGVRNYQAKKFADAYKYFNNGLTYMPGDTTFTYYAGIAALNAKDYPSAIQKYSDLTKTNYSELQSIYTDLSKIYLVQKDTASALRVTAEAVAKYPSNADLATQEIELSLMTGKQKEIVDKISAQAQKDPKNKLYPYYLGMAYYSLKDFDKASEAYKAALAIDPSYADASLNLGTIYMNRGIEFYNAAGKIPVNKQKEFDEAMKKANEQFDQALPYLQKSVDINPKSDIALSNLKSFYIIKKDQAKVAEIQKQLDALK